MTTRPDGIMLSATYDSAGRRTAIIQPRSATTYTYDAAGRLKSVTDPSGIALTASFDGALVTSLAWTCAVAGTVNAASDNDLRATSDNVNGSSSVSYSYDADSLVTQAGGLSVSYDAQNGLLTGTAIGSVTTTQTYNTFGEVSGYNAFYAGSSIYSEADSRDSIGRLTSKVETISGAPYTLSYAYDTAGRLVQLQKDSITNQTYTYDLNGNRLSANGVNATYDGQDRLVTFGTSVYSYTAEGELKLKIVAGQTTTYTYDTLGNLMAVGLPSSTQVSYLIGGLNRRVGKKLNGAQVKGWLYADALRPIAELDGSNAVVSRFVYLGGNAPVYMVKGGQTYRLLTDQVQSVRLVVNTATGAIAQRLDYDEYGNILTDTSPGFQPFGYAGGLYDPDTGLVRFGARDYDSVTGHWTAKDPLRFAGGDTNLYAYVANDPVNRKDENGMDDNLGWGSSEDKVPNNWKKKPNAQIAREKAREKIMSDYQEKYKKANAEFKAKYGRDFDASNSGNFESGYRGGHGPSQPAMQLVEYPTEALAALDPEVIPNPSSGQDLFAGVAGDNHGLVFETPASTDANDKPLGDPNLDTGHYDDGHAFGWKKPDPPKVDWSNLSTTSQVQLDVIIADIESQMAECADDLTAH